MSNDPLFNFQDDAYYVGAWFLAGKDRDFLATIHRDANGTFQLEYRFRYYAPEDGKNDPFDGRDEKSAFHCAIADKTEDEVIAGVDQIVDGLVVNNFCGTRLPWKVKKLRHKVLGRCLGAQFKYILLRQPFVHIKPIGPSWAAKDRN